MESFKRDWGLNESLRFEKIMKTISIKKTKCQTHSSQSSDGSSH